MLRETSVPPQSPGDRPRPKGAFRVANGVTRSDGRLELGPARGARRPPSRTPSKLGSGGGEFTLVLKEGCDACRTGHLRRLHSMLLVPIVHVQRAVPALNEDPSLPDCLLSSWRCAAAPVHVRKP